MGNMDWRISTCCTIDDPVSSNHASGIVVASDVDVTAIPPLHVSSPGPRSFEIVSQSIHGPLGPSFPVNLVTFWAPCPQPFVGLVDGRRLFFSFFFFPFFVCSSRSPPFPSGVLFSIFQFLTFRFFNNPSCDRCPPCEVPGARLVWRPSP